MSKFTEGPWRVEVNERGGLEITCDARESRVPVATVEIGFNEPFESEQEANARLIAVAPTLFDVAKKFQVAFSSAGVVPNELSNDPIEVLSYWIDRVTTEIEG